MGIPECSRMAAAEVVDLCESSGDEAVGTVPAPRPAVLVIDDSDAEGAAEEGGTGPAADVQDAAAAAHAAAELQFCGTPACPRAPVDLLPSILLRPGREYIVGREPSDGHEWVCLQTEAQPLMLSRQHATISCTVRGEWRIIDLGSTNGMLLNGRRSAEAVLTEGACVCVRVRVRCACGCACARTHERTMVGAGMWVGVSNTAM